MYVGVEAEFFFLPLLVITSKKRKFQLNTKDLLCKLTVKIRGFCR
jgi:hypothetical protein